MGTDSSSAAADHDVHAQNHAPAVATPAELSAPAGTLLPDTTPPGQAVALLQDSRLSGRANGPARQEALRQVQRSYGNRAATRLWQHAHGQHQRAHTIPDSAADTMQGTKADDDQNPNANANAAAQQPVAIPDGVPPEGQLPEHGPCDCRACKPDGTTPGAGSGSGATPALAAGPKGVEPGTITINWTNPGGKAVDPFGGEDYNCSHKNATATEAGGKVKLDFTIDVVCKWGVNGGGDTDVPAGDSPVVTAAAHASGKKVYEQIALDLTPAAADNWRPPRKYFWSKSLTERHEQYHTTDDKGWANGDGKQVVINYLKGKTVAGATATAEIATLLTNAMTEMSNANFQWYSGGGKPYIQRPGEMRAFAEGKDAYNALVAAVKKRGAELEAAKHDAPAGAEAAPGAGAMPTGPAAGGEGAPGATPTGPAAGGEAAPGTGVSPPSVAGGSESAPSAGASPPWRSSESTEPSAASGAPPIEETG